jgi:hypothetical protein
VLAGSEALAETGTRRERASLRVANLSACLAAVIVKHADIGARCYIAANFTRDSGRQNHRRLVAYDVFALRRRAVTASSS